VRLCGTRRRRADRRSVAYFAHQKGDIVQRNLALIAVAIALIVVLLVSIAPESVPWLWPWVNLQGPLPN
jgi:hypothetical protein